VLNINQNRSDAFWADLLEPRTYLNIAYLLLGFPLGLMYFVVLVTGLALGLGLSITLLGIPVLLSVVGFVWSFVWFERQAAATVLGLELPIRTPSTTAEVSETPSGTLNSDQASFARSWNTLRAYLVSGVFWRGLAHLFIRFPLGLFGFVVAVVLLSVSAALIGVPFYYHYSDWTFGWPSWQPNFVQAMCVSAVGIGVGLISVRFLNLLAEAMARMTHSLLAEGRLEPQARNNLEPQARNNLGSEMNNDLEPDAHDDRRER
jgi:Putative sensor